MRHLLIVCILWMSWMPLMAQQQAVQLGLLKYSGGGDWYSNPTSLPNLARFCNEHLGTNITIEPATVEVGSPEIFNHPFLHLTGHGNVVFSNEDARNLRNYLMGGGFLHIDDNFGLDPYIRPAMERVFPELEFIEIPFSHDIYHTQFDFHKGLPKIHEHDGKPAQGFGLFWEGRLVCFYSYECDLGDGWEDPEVHKDSEALRRAALEMGSNLVKFAFMQ